MLTLTVGCTEELASAGDDDSEEADDGSVGAERLGETSSELTCAVSSSAYTPYVGGSSPVGTVALRPWRGYSTTYPAGNEDFRGYGSSLPAAVECGGTKTARSHLDVTAGCLTAVNVGDLTRGKITSTTDGAFRALALGFAAGNSAPIKWTDQSIEYRFFYAGISGPGVNPGFKAFTRYRSEDDLYVASWRADGVVQIQKKQCGVYTVLGVLKAYGKPTPNTWHTLRFSAVGSRLELFLDGKRVMSVTDTAFAWGTAGIRTDAMSGAYIDDWRVGP
ncbi:MAG: DUF1080 domain-containing protein [Myxococcota bacterium]|nr:DUF1080 domain-containing protein [Myxococcota bacterium]